MTSAAIEHLALPHAYHLLHCHDYRTLSFGIDVSPYKQIYLVAWSMGVWAASQLFLQGLLPTCTHAVAIAGTPYPRHNEWGIPEAIFDATHDNLDEANRARFNRRMCGGKSLKHLFEALAARTTEEIKEELREVSLHPSIPFVPTDNLWQEVYIPSDDRIIPSTNQLAWWQQTNVQQHAIEGQHYPFGHFSSWKQLLPLS